MDGNSRALNLILDDKVFEDLCEPCKDALIIKLLGKHISYKVLKDRVKALWKLGAGFEI